MEHNTSDNPQSTVVIPRDLEFQKLAAKIPLQGLDAKKCKVFNIWGENGVGKTTFIDQFRKSELMHTQKVLWLQPTEQEDLDTPQEFIFACAKYLKYPQAPEKEGSIEETLTNAQRGKVNPILSDDSILIARSTASKNKKPYINEAAAASVGRTEFIREDIQVSVGLGENKYDSLAEAFLDSLPLQSLGTDAIIINLRYWSKLSSMVTDWLRDYVIPTTSKGPYRRNIIFITESNELEQHGHEDKRWNEWESLVFDYQIHPFDAKRSLSSLREHGLSPSQSYLSYVRSLGYPNSFNSSVSVDQDTEALPEPIIGDLLALSLLDEIYPEEAKIVLRGSSSGDIKSLLSTHTHLFETLVSGKSFKISDKGKNQIISQAANLSEQNNIQTIERALPLARLIRNVPNKSDRVKLLLLSNLNWMNTESLSIIFEEKSDNVRTFVEGGSQHFISKRNHYRISERIRDYLNQVESKIQHVQASEIHSKALHLWNDRKTQIELNLEELNEKIHTSRDQADRYHRQLHSTENRIRSLEKKGHLDPKTASTQTISQKNNGSLILLFSVLAIVLFAFSQSLPKTYNYIAFLSGLISFCGALLLIPSWLRYRALKTAYNGGHDETLEEFLQERDQLHYTAQNQEASISLLKKEIQQTKELLEYPYV